MNRENANKLKIGDTVFANNKEGKVEKGISKDINHINIDIGGGILSTHFENVFLPSEHIKQASSIVAIEAEKFYNLKCFGANVNPRIYDLFNMHWVNMCNAENDTEKYEIHKQEFKNFIKELFDTAKTVNSIKVSGVLYLRQ